jgi:hypothetical protein
MDTGVVPSALQERLGPEATWGLVHLFEMAAGEWVPEIVNLSTERFERRLVEETSKVRVEAERSETRLREEIAGVRVEMARLEVHLHEEIVQQGVMVRQELSANRFELLKWSFLFWVGQVVAIAGLVGVMIRAH